MAVNFNAMILPKFGSSFMEGDTARQNALLKDQQMANTQQEMAMRQKQFGQEEAERQYILSERGRVAAAMAALNKHLEDNGGVPGPKGYRMLIDTRDPKLVQMGMTGFQMLEDEKQINDILSRIGRPPTPSRPVQPMQPMQTRPGEMGRPSLLPQPENFSVAPPTNALTAPQPSALAAAPTNALRPNNGVTQDDLIALASARSPRGKEIANLLKGSTSLGAEYLQLSDRYKLLDPKSPEAIDIRKRMDYMTSIEGKQQPRDMVLPSPGSGQPAIAIRIMPNGTLTQIPLNSVKPEPQLSPIEKEYKAYSDDATAKGEVPMPLDQFVVDKRKKIDEQKARIDVEKKLEIEHPKAIKSVKYVETSVDKEIKLIDELLANERGLLQITGGFAGNIEASYPFGSSARKALATMKTLTQSGVLTGITELKNNGGTLGQVSNVEGDRLEKSRTTATNRTQDAKDVIAALKQYRADLQTSKTAVRDAYNETYSYRNSKPTVDPKMPGWGQ